MPDAVVTYRILGLSIAAITSLIGAAVTLVIIVLTLRIPYKRKYHWMFLIVNFSLLWFSGWAFFAESSTDAATALARFWWHFWVTGPVYALLIFQFVVYFVSPRVTRWQKYVLVGGYAYVAATTWVPLLIDYSFVTTNVFLSATGWVTVPGKSPWNYYQAPSGVNIFFTVMGVLILYLLFRYHRSEKPPLVRGQIEYLIVGTILIFAGGYALNIARYTGGVNLGFVPASAGLFVLLLGLRKKGFYSVTPVAEAAPTAEPVVYPLREGRSYLVRDPGAAFRAFSEHVRGGGREGLLITRTFPADVRSDYGIRTTPIRWLAESEGQDAIPPSDLLGLSLTAKDFMGRASRPIVMLHGVEYLTSYDGFPPVLRLIQGLTEENAARRGILILPVAPETLDRRDDALLATETTPMPTPVPP